MSNTFTVSVITTKIPHHSFHSGYEQLIKYLPESTEIKFVKRGHATNGLSRLIEVGLRFFTTSRWYQWDGVIADLFSAKILSRKKSIVHYLYGDSSVGLIPYVNGYLPGKLILSIHACPTDFNEVIQFPHLLKNVDGLILLGSNQKEYFESLLIDSPKLHVIPHGVNIEFFTPVATKPENEYLNVLLVGNWRRNFELYGTVIEACESEKMIFHVVTQSFNHHHFRGFRNVKLYSTISDDCLKELYQFSDVLFMALTDAVANNVLLEAAACGLPIICEDIGAVRDYFSDEEIAYFEPNAASQVIDLLKQANKNRTDLFIKRDKALLRVQEYAWQQIAKKTFQFYESVINA
ncbi:MAG: glycosyltransferase family 4 protein [Bacteroidetes bacterium]|nr:glycosyltransferase family 4 protein [Bacteroidota bacterium]